MARYVFKVPGMRDHPELGVDNGRLIVSGSTVKKIFQPVVTEILNLVQGQLDTVRRNNSRIKAIFMTGGFGNNDYLKEKISQKVGRGVKVNKMQNW